jgi:hypothetical protein
VGNMMSESLYLVDILMVRDGHPLSIQPTTMIKEYLTCEGIKYYVRAVTMVSIILNNHFSHFDLFGLTSSF